MASADFVNLSLRNLTAYNSDGSYVSSNYVFTVGQYGKQLWTNKLNLDSVNVSTLFIASTYIIENIGGSSIIASTFINGTTSSNSINVSTLYSNYAIYYSTLYGNNITSLNDTTNQLNVLSTANISTLSTKLINYSTLYGSTIQVDFITVNSTILVSSINTVTYTASTLVGSTLSVINGVIDGSPLGTSAPSTSFIARFGNGSGIGPTRYGGVDFCAIRNTTGTYWSTSNIRLRKTVDFTSMCYIDFGRNVSDPRGMGFGQGNSEYMCITESGQIGIGTPTPLTKLHVVGNTSTTTARVEQILNASSIISREHTVDSLLIARSTLRVSTISSVRLSSITMTGPITLGTNRATTSYVPTSGIDLTNKTYVDSLVSGAITFSTIITSSIVASSTITTSSLSCINLSSATLRASTISSVSLSSITMTGPITLGTNRATTSYVPTSGIDLTNKTYVDSLVSGAITFSTIITSSIVTSSTITTSSLSCINLSSVTVNGSLSLGTNKATTSYVPISGNDLTNKTYVDYAITGSLPLPFSSFTGSTLVVNNLTATNFTLIESTLNVNTIQTTGNITVNSTLTVSTINTKLLNFSTLIGSTITSNRFNFNNSTLYNGSAITYINNNLNSLSLTLSNCYYNPPPNNYFSWGDTGILRADVNINGMPTNKSLVLNMTFNSQFFGGFSSNYTVYIMSLDGVTIYSQQTYVGGAYNSLTFTNIQFVLSTSGFKIRVQVNDPGFGIAYFPAPFSFNPIVLTSAGDENIVYINSTLIARTINTTSLTYSTMSGSTITSNTQAINSTLTASTINTTSLTYSTMSGSTITSNTQTINSTLIASTINTTSLTYSTMSGSTITSNTQTVNSTLTASTITASGNASVTGVLTVGTGTTLITTSSISTANIDLSQKLICNGPIGEVQFSNTWTSKATSSEWKSISISSDGKYQTAVTANSDSATNNGIISISSDYGNTWTTANNVNANYVSIALSSTGQYQIAVADNSTNNPTGIANSKIYISSDYGATWTGKLSSGYWKSVSISSSGQYQGAVLSGGQIYISDDYGDNWIPKDSNRNWSAISISSSGQYQTATVYYITPPYSGGQIYISDDYGNTWIAKDSNRYWTSVSISSTGQYQTACEAGYQQSGGRIYISNDYGNTWTPKDSNRTWQSVSISSSGQYQAAVVYGGQIYVSSDYGNTWTPKDSNRAWTSISISSTGLYVSATTQINGYIYISVGSYTILPSTIINSSTIQVSTINTTSLTYSTMSGSTITSNTQTINSTLIASTINITSIPSSRALITYSDNNISTSITTATELDYVSGVTAPIQTQINSLSINTTNQLDTFSKFGISLSNFGNTWTAKDSNRNWQSISISASGQYQTAIVLSGQIYVSSDYGNIWNPKDSDRSWSGVSISASGQYQTACVGGYLASGQIYVSSDYGNTWTAKASNLSWIGVSISASGQYQTAVVQSGQIYVSSDYGNTWTAKDTSRNWQDVFVSASGQYQTAVVFNGQLYVSSDYGNTWTAKDSSRQWNFVSISASGQYQTAIVQSGQIYVSSDYGNTWTAKDSNRYWVGISISASGQYQIACVGGALFTGQIYVSSDYGNTWTAKASTLQWQSVAISASGQYQTAVVTNGQIYVSVNIPSNTLDKTGDTMTGTLNMGSNNIITTGTITTSNLSGTTMTGALNMGSNNITTTGTINIPNEFSTGNTFQNSIVINNNLTPSNYSITLGNMTYNSGSTWNASSGASLQISNLPLNKTYTFSSLSITQNGGFGGYSINVTRSDGSVIRSGFQFNTGATFDFSGTQFNLSDGIITFSFPSPPLTSVVFNSIILSYSGKFVYINDGIRVLTDSAYKPATNTWTISSDERLKNNIILADLDKCYSTIKYIPLKRYTWKNEIYSNDQVKDRNKLGWIAQDIETIFPKAVGKNRFIYNQKYEIVTKEDGSTEQKLISQDTIEDCRDLNVDQIYAVMYGAVQKTIQDKELLEQQVQQQANTISTLQNQLTQLTTWVTNQGYVLPQ